MRPTPTMFDLLPGCQPTRMNDAGSKREREDRRSPRGGCLIGGWDLGGKINRSLGGRRANSEGMGNCGIMVGFLFYFLVGRRGGGLSPYYTLPSGGKAAGEHERMCPSGRAADLFLEIGDGWEARWPGISTSSLGAGLCGAVAGQAHWGGRPRTCNATHIFCDSDVVI